MKKPAFYKYYTFFVALSFIIVFIGCKVQEKELSNRYSFFVAGHVYGTPNENAKGVYPSFLTKIIEDQNKYSFGVFTGDIVEKPIHENWVAVKNDLKEIKNPVYFAPGNHDMGDRELYQQMNGNADTCFTVNDDVFLFFDNTKYGWDLDTLQTILLDEAISKLSKKSKLFVFGHNVLWQDKYGCALSNSTIGRGPENHFWTKVIPRLKKLENTIYWFAGDVGATAKSKNVSYIVEQNVHLITSGMGNKINDNFLQIHVNNHEVKINVVALNNQDVKPIDSFKCK